MAATAPHYNKEEFARRGDAIYDTQFRHCLEANDEGKFLAIDLATKTGSCGAAGNFQFGTIRFIRIDADTPVLEPLGTVLLGANEPSSVVVSPTGAFGYVTTTGGAVLRFDVTTRQTINVTLPQPNGFTAIGPLGISASGSDVVPQNLILGAVVTVHNRRGRFSGRSASGRRPLCRGSASAPRP